MTQFWPRFKWRIIAASLGALFHLFTVVLVLVLSGGKGEEQAFLVIFLDFPLVVLYKFLGGFTFLFSLLESMTAYLLFFSIGGTMMYGLLGWCIGLLIDRRISKKFLNKD